MTTPTAKIWLTVLRAKNQPVTRLDVRKALPRLTARRVSNIMHRMVLTGHVVREGQPGHYTYRVTPHCTTPVSVPLRDVLEAIQ